MFPEFGTPTPPVLAHVRLTRPGFKVSNLSQLRPFSAPGSLTDDQVYSVVAYILSEAKIIQPTDVMNADTLPKVVMPNRDGFIPDSRPELELYR